LTHPKAISYHETRQPAGSTNTANNTRSQSSSEGKSTPHMIRLQQEITTRSSGSVFSKSIQSLFSSGKIEFLEKLW
jgi:hypothetical protein